jgi:RNA 3'-phosphate cyclase
LQVLGRLFAAEVKGVEIGSTEVAFSPGRTNTDVTEVNMKTAASITLLLQALVPSVALSGARATLHITGGTDVPWSPTLDYFSEVVRPAYDLLGIRFSITAVRRGFYPRGGGRVNVEIEPSGVLRPLEMSGNNAPSKVGIISRCAKLPRHVAERQLDSMLRAFSEKRIAVSSTSLSEDTADSPGSSILAYTVEKGCMLGADALGAKGKPAEDVGRQAALAYASTASTGACVDSNLADMIAPLLSLSNRDSILRIPAVSQHLKTTLHVARSFTGCDYSWRQDQGSYLLSINPLAGHNV